MKNHKLLLALLGFLLGIAVLISISLNRDYSENLDLPVSIATLNDHSLLFHCYIPTKCPQSINIDNYIQPIEESYHLDKVTYAGPDHIYAILYDSAKNGFVFNINQQTNQVSLIKLPIQIDSNLSIVKNELLVIGNRHGMLVVIQDDKVFQNINLLLNNPQSSIEHIVVGDTGNIIAINGIPNITLKNIYAEIYIVNIHSGTFEKKEIDVSNIINVKEHDNSKIKIMYFTNISSDLKEIYYFYTVGKSSESPIISFGVFDTQDHKVLASTDNISCLNWMSGYSQYKDILFSSRFNLETSQPATLLDMDTLKPITEILNSVTENDSKSAKFIIAPFGSGLVLGTDQRLTFFSLDGKVKKQFSVPREWLNLNYLIFESRDVH